MLNQKEKESKKAVGAADIVINASPVGMHPKEDETPIPAEWIKPNAAVFDVVYSPIKTRFIREAAARGCCPVSGVEMFLNQAALQFERWTGKPAPIKLMRRIVIKNLGAK
jgi:shikimate dehydrogenase